MSPEVGLQVFVNGLMLGAVVVLVALGMTLVFGIMHMINFAHGEVFMLGAFGIYLFSFRLGLSYYQAFIITVILLALFGVLLERVLFRPFRGYPLPCVISTVGLALFLQSFILMSFGIEDKYIPRVFTGLLGFFGASISVERLAVTIAAIVLVLALHFFLQRVKQGWAMRAVAEEPEAAALQGINIDATSRLSMVIGCALAAAAGALIAPVFWVNPFMGTMPLLKSFVIIIVGGMGSVPGTIFAGFALGMIESAGTFFLDAELATIIYFAIVIVVLLVRPTGLLGRA